MSYNIEKTSPFISIKLTDKGRERLSQGNLTFDYWAVGDSEINYDRESVLDDNSGDAFYSGGTKILRAKDNQPNLRFYVTTGDTATPFINMTPANLRNVKLIVNNEATERGFFSGDTSNYITQLTDPYIMENGVVLDSQFNGGNTVDIGTSGITEDNFILFKFTNDTLGTQATGSNIEPTPHLWYQIDSVSGSTIEVDRDLPNLGASGGTNVQWIVYEKGEVYQTMGENNVTSYFNSNTLSFDSSCDVSCNDVSVWNMNNVFCESLAGMSGGTYQDYTKFGSYDYLGQKYPYLDYICANDDSNDEVTCEGESVIDGVKKSVSIIHYTNNTISNFYGEQLFIDVENDKLTKLHLPTLMYHRREFSGGTGNGTIMGMTFESGGELKKVGDIEYYDLLEDSTLVNGDPIAVGRVFPQLKVVVIDDDEIVAGLSYKSNRNWTLPRLNANLRKSAFGNANAVLEQDETIYMTYTLANDSTSGYTTPLHCQNYIKLKNTTPTAKDVAFRLEDLDLLPYMRKIEDVSYDGRGFYAHNFKVIYQIVEDDERPDPSAWKVYDYTTSGLTGSVGETIDPTLLETQSSDTYNFIIDQNTISGSTIYDIHSTLNLPLNSAGITPLTFGDERFFYGNLQTYIGATIYKSLFSFNVDGGQFITTTNPTRDNDPNSNPPNLRISEIGVYDDEFNLVMIGKVSSPIEVVSTNTITIELAIDF